MYSIYSCFFCSMILSKNAFTGFTFEHAWGDGVAGMDPLIYTRSLSVYSVIAKCFVELYSNTVYKLYIKSFSCSYFDYLFLCK